MFFILNRDKKFSWSSDSHKNNSVRKKKNNCEFSVDFQPEFRCFETQKIFMLGLRNAKIDGITNRGRLYNDRKRFPGFLRSDSFFL